MRDSLKIVIWVAKMKQIDYNRAASLDFERSIYAVTGEGDQPVSVRVWCSVRQKPLTQFRLAGQFNQTLSNSGFFSSIVAALPALSVGKSQPPERTDELSILGVGWGRGVSQPRRTGRDEHRVISAVTGLPSRADGWTDFRHIVQRAGMQERQRTGIAGRDNPRPQH